MHVDLEPIIHRAPQRILAAALKDNYGNRLGRFGLSERNGYRWHEWEWLEGNWPDGIFYMEPSVTEPPPCEVLSVRYGLPPLGETDMTTPERLSERCTRYFEVLRIDDDTRRIATLGLGRHHLLWIEQQLGGVLELCPAWLAFRPCQKLDPTLLERRHTWTQPRERKSLNSQAVTMADTEPFLSGWHSAATVAAWPL